MDGENHASLVDALAKHGIELADDQIEKLDGFCTVLWQWNEKLNLTRHTDYEKFVTRDLIDARQVAECLKPGESVLDVGTGGGLPGIPLAILHPDIHVTVVDSVGKKIRAVDDIIRSLELPVVAYHDKVQHLLEMGHEHYDTLLARAVGRMDEVLRWLEPHWGRFGRLLLLKGPRWSEERGQARHVGLLHDKRLRCLRRYPRSGADGESVLLEIRPTQDLPYP